MIATPLPHPMTVTDYLDWEPCQEMRYEFVNGDIRAMTGGTLAHNDIAINAILTPKLEGERGKAAGGMRLKSRVEHENGPRL